MRTAIIGGGAAGFFLAVNLKEMCPQMQVRICERSQHVLQKVAVSGGGRCNCTNSFEDVTDLSQVYPRGHRLLKRLFKSFGPRDAYEWFEHHGVPLTTQADHCVFPAAQDSQAIIQCFLSHARRLGVEVQTGRRITSLDDVADADYIVVTTGGSPRIEGLQWLANAGHAIVPPVPSLFTFNIPDNDLRDLMGTVVEHATALLPGTKLRAEGPLLVTHWGMSGPAILRLSSYAARLLAEHDYRMPLSINWLSMNDTEISALLTTLAHQNPQKSLVNVHPQQLPRRLWEYILQKTFASSAASLQKRWCDLSDKEMRRLVNTLANDNYRIDGRGQFKEEFVTCGGVALGSVNSNTLESRHRPGLFFAGEVLDIDGVTGGFNFQAAWTTAYTVAQHIASEHV